MATKRDGREMRTTTLANGVKLTRPLKEASGAVPANGKKVEFEDVPLDDATVAALSASVFQVMPPLDAATDAALRATLKRHGVLMPIAVDQHNRILDGHQRFRIATEESLPFKTLIFEVRDDDHARELARTLNEDRRQLLDIDQRRQVVADLRRQGHSQRATAKALGVDEKTIRNDVKAAEAAGADLSAPAKVRGRDGKLQTRARNASSPPSPSLASMQFYREASRRGVTAKQFDDFHALKAFFENVTKDARRAMRKLDIAGTVTVMPMEAVSSVVTDDIHRAQEAFQALSDKFTSAWMRRVKAENGLADSDEAA